MNEFSKLGLKNEIVSVLEDLRIVEPTEIQAKTIPLILEGKDVIGNAKTGSGKTLAFASGIFDKVKPGEGIQALVLTPTRELTEQVAKVMRTFSRNTKISILEVYGGVGYSGQISGSERADIIVGTPGRILDHLEKRNFDFMDLKILVLDEADRMVDMGFLRDVEKIIGQCPKKRQTLLFSATSSPDVNYISGKYMINPIHISAEQYVDASKLTQYYYDVPTNMKFSLLVHLLKEEKGIVMVFCNTRRNVDLIAMNLKRYGIYSNAIHGGLTQNRRSRAIEKLHENEADILVCTDVAARGLDIKGITHVYNYDIPRTREEYIHRIGRTARAGKEGMAVNIVSPNDYDNFRRIIEDESLNIELKETPEVENLFVRFQNEGRGGRDGGRRFGGRGGDRRPGGRGGYSRGGSRGGDSRRSSGRRDSRPRGRSYSRR